MIRQQEGDTSCHCSISHFQGFAVLTGLIVGAVLCNEISHIKGESAHSSVFEHQLAPARACGL